MSGRSTSLENHYSRYYGSSSKWSFMIISRSFLSIIQKLICCGHSLELPHRGSSNDKPQHMIVWKSKKKYPKIITTPHPPLWSADGTKQPDITFLLANISVHFTVIPLYIFTNIFIAKCTFSLAAASQSLTQYYHLVDSDFSVVCYLK